MFRRWRYVSCVYGDENVMKRAMKIKRYIEKHLRTKVECKLEMRIGDGEFETSAFDMYMHLTNDETAFVRGLVSSEGFYERATKEKD